MAVTKCFAWVYTGSFKKSGDIAIIVGFIAERTKNWAGSSQKIEQMQLELGF